ncbi:MAG: ABC transporter substrate-binding protein [Acidobacteria bacterium]|nr:MAG: ABC transporter substrate-binding protein [Acidobacteriota bacterium]
MKRRAFIAGLGVTAAWPLAARGQQRVIPLIGVFLVQSRASLTDALAAFNRGLGETGYVEGQNVALEYRSADGQIDQLPTLAADLVRRQPIVLVAGGNAAALAAKAVTATVPIVFLIGGDPLRLGLVSSLNRPGGNVTGVSFFANQLETKRLGLLHELAPRASEIAALVNPGQPAAEAQSNELIDAARTLGVKLHILNARNEHEIDTAFAMAERLGVGALVVAADPFFSSRREQLVSLAARYATPAIYEWRDFAALGGLASYGTSLTDAFRQAGVYAGRVLKGEKPGALPVVQTTKFEFVINLKTANTLGLAVSPTLSARADEVIE